MIPAAYVVALSDILQKAEEQSVPVLLVGALARDLCLPPEVRTDGRRTDDVDLVVLIGSWGRFDSFLDGCEEAFELDRSELRLRHRRTRVPVDVAPCGGVEEEPGKLALHGGSRVLSVAGMSEAFARAARQDLGGRTLFIPSPAAFVLFKLLSFLDRRAPRDLQDLGHVLRTMPIDDDLVFADEQVLDLLADGELVYEDLAVWQLGRSLRDEFSEATVAAFRGALAALVEEGEVTRSHLVFTGGVTDLAPEERLERADQVIQVLARAVRPQ